MKVYVVCDVKNGWKIPKVFEREIDAEIYKEDALAIGENVTVHTVETKPDNPYQTFLYFKGYITLYPPNDGFYDNLVDGRTAMGWKDSFDKRRIDDGCVIDGWYHIDSLGLYGYQRRGRQTINIVAKDENHFYEIVKQIEKMQQKILLSATARFRYFVYSGYTRVKSWFGY